MRRLEVREPDTMDLFVAMQPAKAEDFANQPNTLENSVMVRWQLAVC
jgi:hypothetical protein